MNISTHSSPVRSQMPLKLVLPLDGTKTMLPGGSCPDDYNGESRWIECRDGNKWYVVCLPAEAERTDDILGRQVGERIWPEWFPEDHFKPFKRQPRTWSALYQQRPSPDTGDYFQGDWLRPWPGDKMPARDSFTSTALLTMR